MLAALGNALGNLVYTAIFLNPIGTLILPNNPFESTYISSKQIEGCAEMLPMLTGDVAGDQKKTLLDTLRDQKKLLSSIWIFQQSKTDFHLCGSWTI